MCFTKSNHSCASYNQDDRVPLATIRGQIGYRGWFWLTLMSTSGLRVKRAITDPSQCNYVQPHSLVS